MNQQHRPDDRFPEEAKATLTERLPVETIIHRADQAPQQVFGILVELAMKNVEAYFSDLYHDSLKIQGKDWTKPVTLYFATGKFGTNLADTYADISVAVVHGRPNLYELKYRYHPTLMDSFSLAIKKVDLPTSAFH